MNGDGTADEQNDSARRVAAMYRSLKEESVDRPSDTAAAILVLATVLDERIGSIRASRPETGAEPSR